MNYTGFLKIKQHQNQIGIVLDYDVEEVKKLLDPNS